MAKAIMIQGTMSNAGKSIFAAALCRIFKQDGYKVCPFKSQNMALNSYITKDGLEMGRAQVVQAEAAGIEPSVYMNPILLKPTTNTKSQVIINGEVYKDMSAREYFLNKKAYIPYIKEAFDKLSEEYDIIVIEGAGSPVELNLKKDDIVNMGMAEIANSPVLLVGDIDRGGVFAQLIGTYDLFTEDEKKYVKGLIVNKFRGDVTLFDDGIKILEDKTGVKVAGVVPYVDVDIEDEDSLSEKLNNRLGYNTLIDICIVRLPKLSNFTDFDVFSEYEDITVRYAANPGEIGTPDLLIIPGTKNTTEDALFLKENGFYEMIRKLKEQDIPIWGICGGYQILGEMIDDSENAESGLAIDGIGLLPIRTVFGDEKLRTRQNGRLSEVGGIFSDISDKCYYGYEIHMGKTYFSNGNEIESNIVNVGNVYGTYIHGIFDDIAVSDAVVKALCDRKGIPAIGKCMTRYEYKEKQYDILADTVRSSIDIEYIYKVLEEGI